MPRRHKPYGPGDGLPVIASFNPDQFRADRHAAGLSLSELARRAKVGRQTVSAWENGKAVPSRQFFPRVLDALWRDQ